MLLLLLPAPLSLLYHSLVLPVAAHYHSFTSFFPCLRLCRLRQSVAAHRVRCSHFSPRSASRWHVTALGRVRTAFGLKMLADLHVITFNFSIPPRRRPGCLCCMS
uniref:Putative secreted protein n=1 Tax=Anopheles triannulatus TaxID=58253 RepID=A0A2M4B545_9DIPT